jgi:ABC-type branched-subunit amino acid transport system substrate-binding protein
VNLDVRSSTSERPRSRRRRRQRPRPRSRPRRRLRALSLIVALAACGPGRGPTTIPDQDQDHVTTRHGRDAEDPAARLARAIAGTDPFAVIRAAGHVAAAGGDLTPHRAAIHAAIDRTDPDLLAIVAEELGAREPAGAVRLRIALLAEHTGDRDAAAAQLALAQAAADGALFADRTAALAKALAEPSPDPAVIAILAPLSGPHAGLGQEVVAAAQLAIPTGTVLVPIDTRGEPDGAVAAVDAAIGKRAIAIVGPVGDKESLAAARRAAIAGIPIGLLAAADGADPGSGVFRLVSSPADEARMAAWLAAGEGYPTAGVLAPRDDVGAEAAAAFVEAATARGVAVTARGDYDPTSAALEPDVKAFLGLVPATNPRLRDHLRRNGKKGWQTFSPDVPFAFLYIPDRFDRATLAVAFLPYLGVELRTTEFSDPELLRRKHRGRIPQVVQLVGDSGWNDARLLVRGGATVEGALVVTTFAGELDAGPGGELAARFAAATGRKASAMAAQAHDAVRLVLAARDKAGLGALAGRARWAAMARALVGTRLDDGACGPAQIDPSGEVLRDPIVLQVDAGELVLAP